MLIMVVGLAFEPRDYSVSFQAETINLLAKEYALLEFLYRNRGKVFSREQLLDQVWPMEYPGERTVDDHVYRLRKRMKPWSGKVQLITVRGLGYSLTIKETLGLAVPSLTDSGLQKQIGQLLDTYLMLGQSQSMLALVNQQELLGVNISPSHQMFLKFVRADLDWFLESSAENPDKLYWLLIFYYSFYMEPAKSLNYFERTIESGILPFEMHRELKVLNILGLYADNGRVEEDLQRVQEAYRIIEKEQGKLDTFKVHIAMSEMHIHLVAGSIQEAERCSRQIEDMLAEAPYLREISAYHGLRGKLLLHQGRPQEAAAAFEYGFEAGETAHHVPLLARLIIGTLHFLKTSYHDPKLLQTFQTRYDEFERGYKLEAYKQPIEQMIERILGSV
ncbi:winged helix-turn-helix domain-containing protein [Paenibacillus sp. chi10]|uniref:Winged helix-turn-helix domain-containing protein n=1 Tax=Paenibacillus suaedae TaxID=3077233 RepID=A0AAJ2K306_9BACL|nr:winged helix-turn-helix domain-containing protein [Paenibacillus sp. chi10]MDT8979449.1 winged helix-turn-helix domain-containing protein [Paenibacillus sp. chi10]